VNQERVNRLATELEAVRALRKASTILEFEPKGDPPDHYTVIFRGRGISQARAEVTFTESHRVDLRLPYSFPNKPPDIRWVTPIFHPNISFSGFISLKDIGLPWEPDLGLDVVFERLWDIARLAYMDLEMATNDSAKNWFQDNQLDLPIDKRPLRDRSAPSGTNVIRYERRGERRVPMPGQESGEVLFIGEDTPTPDVPVRIVSYRYGQRDDDDILYIE